MAGIEELVEAALEAEVEIALRAGALAHRAQEVQHRVTVRLLAVLVLTLVAVLGYDLVVLLTR